MTESHAGRICKRALVSCLIGHTLLASSQVSAGEISGLPPSLAPTTQPEYTFYFGNDFLTAGTNDDFRTQQLMASLRIKDRWRVVLDHSILTREHAESGPPARLDQMSLSVGYEWLRRVDASGRSAVSVGIGARGAGNYEGSRIQNGFHSLIESEVSFLPYASTREVDATVWAFGETHRVLRTARGDGVFSGWDTGYWARGGALATSDGQLDVVAGLYAIASRPGFDLWLGLRRDWREGYDSDLVQRETAAEESKLALSYGLRLGSIVMETVQRFDSYASYGQISFVSSPATRRNTTPGRTKSEFQLGLHMPHMLMQMAGRWHRPVFLNTSSQWRESITADLRGGQPQIGQDVNRYAETLQLTMGLEYSRRTAATPDWLRFYGAASIGWRTERFIGRGALSGVKSEAVGRAVLQTDLGVEVDAVRMGNNWRHKLRLGVSAWAPTESVTIMTGGEPTTLLEPGVAISVGWTFSYH